MLLASAVMDTIIREDLECKRDVSNTRDTYAVGIMQHNNLLTSVLRP